MSDNSSNSNIGNERDMEAAVISFLDAIEPVVRDINSPDRISAEDATSAERALIMVHGQLRRTMNEAKWARMTPEEREARRARVDDDQYDRREPFLSKRHNAEVRAAIVAFLSSVGGIVRAIGQDSVENCSSEEEGLLYVCYNLGRIVKAMDRGTPRGWPFARAGANETVKAAVEVFRSRVAGYCAATYGAILDEILADLAVAEAQEGYKYIGWHFYDASTRYWREVVLVCNMANRRLERIEDPGGCTVDDATYQKVMGQMPYAIDVPGYKGRFDPDVDECIRAVLPERKPATSESKWSEPVF